MHKHVAVAVAVPAPAPGQYTTICSTTQHAVFTMDGLDGPCRDRRRPCAARLRLCRAGPAYRLGWPPDPTLVTRANMRHRQTAACPSLTPYRCTTLQTGEHFVRWGPSFARCRGESNTPSRLTSSHHLSDTAASDGQARQSHVASHEERSTYIHYESTTTPAARSPTCSPAGPCPAFTVAHGSLCSSLGLSVLCGAVTTRRPCGRRPV